ncbi:MAG: type II toxin-antitoxin system RelE/ParE family toxin [Bacteroidetes bacterium]|jgi:mRNA interferase RelE/StbE|nr:type II toxin-antitoxin system RelE/ParE family toxin [Bacteroidota bacterium]MBK9400020.1 type II toxin-antitoxin system RelE/ParE family toxin [Bacteroidota bacterium]
MIVEFDKSFYKSLDKLKDKSLFPKIEKVISILEKTSSLNEIASVKKLIGYKVYYRYRLGDYRIGIEQISKNTLRLIIIAHRKDVYNVFP